MPTSTTVNYLVCDVTVQNEDCLEAVAKSSPESYYMIGPSFSPSSCKSDPQKIHVRLLRLQLVARSWECQALSTDFLIMLYTGSTCSNVVLALELKGLHEESLLLAIPPHPSVRSIAL